MGICPGTSSFILKLKRTSLKTFSFFRKTITMRKKGGYIYDTVSYQLLNLMSHVWIPPPREVELVEENWHYDQLIYESHVFPLSVSLHLGSLFLLIHLQKKHYIF
jgi:hypothetical protein